MQRQPGGFSLRLFPAEEEQHHSRRKSAHRFEQGGGGAVESRSMPVSERSARAWRSSLWSYLVVKERGGESQSGRAANLQNDRVRKSHISDLKSQVADFSNHGSWGG